MNAPENALELAGVSVTRGSREVLSEITTTCARGKLTVVIGPNGAGKSTLLAVAAGLLAPSAGSVTFAGEPIALISRQNLARRRAYLPQNARVDWPLSVERVVALGLTPVLPAFGGLGPYSAAVAASLSANDLMPLRDRAASAVSGGELARVMIARATVGDPELLIADEPTAGLDPRHALDAARRLRARADAGRTVVAALHDLTLALNIADEVIALKDGRVAWAQPAATVDGPALARLFDVDVRLTRDNGVGVRFG